MLKGKIILCVAFLFWVASLVFITFFSNNPYLNGILLFFVLMVTVAILTYGCEVIEKVNENHKK